MLSLSAVVAAGYRGREKGGIDCLTTTMQKTQQLILSETAWVRWLRLFGHISRSCYAQDDYWSLWVRIEASQKEWRRPGRHRHDVAENSGEGPPALQPMSGICYKACPELLLVACACGRGGYVDDKPRTMMMTVWVQQQASAGPVTNPSLSDAALSCSWWQLKSLATWTEYFLHVTSEAYIEFCTTIPDTGDYCLPELIFMCPFSRIALVFFQHSPNVQELGK